MGERKIMNHFIGFFEAFVAGPEDVATGFVAGSPNRKFGLLPLF
jgi:hypothetical protein